MQYVGALVVFVGAIAGIGIVAWLMLWVIRKTGCKAV